jgi:hypothetical protein
MKFLIAIFRLVFIAELAMVILLFLLGILNNITKETWLVSFFVFIFVGVSLEIRYRK